MRKGVIAAVAVLATNPAFSQPTYTVQKPDGGYVEVTNMECRYAKNFPGTRIYALRDWPGYVAFSREANRAVVNIGCADAAKDHINIKWIRGGEKHAYTSATSQIYEDDTPGQMMPLE
ncbi:hypothetical protein [Burkholderia anthina]|uniref:hypothetical protein n=1 Tax=Burkholderia anthina TaxID=179879 RepID=UPI00158D5487|nr:hypothetical protein [Burkholderia anthina]